jgi:hypothetical protein
MRLEVKRRAALPLLFLALLLASPLASSQDDPDLGESTATFVWALPHVPAVITVPIPDGLSLSEIEDVSVPGAVRLVGYGLRPLPPAIELYLQPEADAASFRALEVRLASGAEMSYPIGPVTVVALEGTVGVLRHERSLSVAGRGLLLAAAIRNAGEREVALTGIDYLPDPYRPGSLLVAVVDDPLRALADLEQRLASRYRHERSTGRRDEEPLPGFRWLDPRLPDLPLAPGEAAVLAWTPAAFEPSAAPASFRLQPVVTYLVAGESVDGRIPERSLGLPLGLRQP